MVGVAHAPEKSTIKGIPKDGKKKGGEMEYLVDCEQWWGRVRTIANRKPTSAPIRCRFVVWW